MISFDLFWQALLLGFVEGITEFLPISSTGHLIVAADLLQFTGEKANTFLIVIQLAAILAVVWEYRAKLWPLRTLLNPASYKNFTAVYTTPQSSLRLGIHLLIAFLPAAVLGVLLHKTIKQVLFHPIPVALALIIGAFFIFILERKHPKPRVMDVYHLTGWDALKIGFAQSLAMIPGTSRAGATIIGGMWFGLSRVAATEFSFFLAIPTILGATVYDLYKNYSLFSWSDLPLFSVGCISAFFSAWLTIRGLIRYISRHNFVVFAWYRLAFGGVILLTWKLGWVQWA